MCIRDRFKREEAALVFQSGFLANLGVIQAITDKGDLIISDELNHASIIDGVRSVSYTHLKRGNKLMSF